MRGTRALQRDDLQNGHANRWSDEPTKAIEPDSDDRDVSTIFFASGNAAGEFARDNVCVSEERCAVMDFVQLTEESDDPFKDAEWDEIGRAHV